VDEDRCVLGCYALAIALMMEAVSTFETSVNFYQTTQRNNLEESHLHTHRRENLKSHVKSGRLLEKWRCIISIRIRIVYYMHGNVLAYRINKINLSIRWNDMQNETKFGHKFCIV
jgi:hypothetical protein